MIERTEQRRRAEAFRALHRPRLDCILSLARPAQRPLTPRAHAVLELLREFVPSELYPRHESRG